MAANRISFDENSVLTQTDLLFSCLEKKSSESSSISSESSLSCHYDDSGNIHSCRIG